MLQVYLEVPGFLGGGKRKARIIIEKISKISETEGKRQDPFTKIFQIKNIEKSTFYFYRRKRYAQPCN